MVSYMLRKESGEDDLFEFWVCEASGGDGVVFCQSVDYHFSYSWSGAEVQLVECVVRAMRRNDVSGRPDLVGAITQYTPSWNVAKHDYDGGGRPQSVITLDDAIRNYFVARSLGAAVLKSIGSLSRTVQAIEAASDNHSYYNRGYLLDTRVHPLVQSTKDVPNPGVVEHGDTHGLPTLSQRPELYVTPIHVVATRSFSDWLDRLPYAPMVAVVAAVERFAAYGRRLGPPEVEQVLTRAFPETYVLVPEPPAVGRQVLFAFDPTGRAVLIEGDYSLGKRKRAPRCCPPVPKIPTLVSTSYRSRSTTIHRRSSSPHR